MASDRSLVFPVELFKGVEPLGDGLTGLFGSTSDCNNVFEMIPEVGEIGTVFLLDITPRGQDEAVLSDLFVGSTRRPEVRLGRCGRLRR